MPRSITIFIVLFMLPFHVFAQGIKESDLAGTWYPGPARVLKEEINDYLDAAMALPLDGEPIALILPHAGLVYSAETLAYGFKTLDAEKIKKIILVGFSHRLDFDGTAVFSGRGFKTPLGILPIDKELSDKIYSSDEKIFVYPPAFDSENSIEIIIPFIQVFFDRPKAVLIALGRQSWENVRCLGRSLAAALKGEDDCLIIASTDMSHYLPLADALRVDRDTAELLKRMDPQELFDLCRGKNRMCGLGAVAAVMIAAKELGADKLQVLKESTSAEASRDKSRVVGYLSAAMLKTDGQQINSAESIKLEEKENKVSNRVEEDDGMRQLLNAKQREELLKLARDTLEHYLGKGEVLDVSTDDAVLNKIMGVFVTLRRDHQLRGCIGNIIGSKPLYLGVRDMAIAAATQDFRFRPVTGDELSDIDIEISALSPLEQITDTDRIILGKHGVLVRDAYRSGVYLPQVAVETGWNKKEFMDSLCGHKAGMASDAWRNGKCDIFIFSAEVFQE